jgi:uncharacterized membrane protein/nitrite reductase/ring-hydroxylating ferredoxin subunit
MRSKAQFKTHPIHPMLVAFPIAFLVGAPTFDIAGVLGDWPPAWTTGAFLSVAAVLSGLAAGVPGFIDYLYVIPPNSSAKNRAIQHMVVNVSALVLVAVGWAFRDWASLRPQTIALILEVAGLVMVTFGGWLGGTLAYRNQIGVDHRYANAGKWREQWIEGRPGEAVAIEGANELKAGHMMLLRIGNKDRRIVLARTAEGYAAFDDHCTHKGGTLAGGILACDTVTCPWHGSQFSVKDGSVRSGPAEKPIAMYRVEESGGRVRVVIPDK